MVQCVYRSVQSNSVSGTDLYKVPDAVPYHLMKPPIRAPPSSGLFLAIIYNQSQLAERKHVARYWSISAVPVSAHPSPLIITTKLAAAILVVAVVRRRGSAGPVLPVWSAEALGVVIAHLTCASSVK